MEIFLVGNSGRLLTLMATEHFNILCLPAGHWVRQLFFNIPYGSDYKEFKGSDSLVLFMFRDYFFYCLF